jgi:poly-beta-1,6-N-acetyl-D-glucosamine synthase
MTVAAILFWLSFAVLFYCYAGYGIFLFLWNNLKKVFSSRAASNENQELLPVTLVVPAYNEEGILEQKIRNTLEIDYPADLLHVIFITDGSTDSSSELIGKCQNIQLLHQSERKGKSAAIKRAMRFVETPVVIFSDANSMLNKGCIKAIVRHYANEKVGGVAGEKKILNDEHSSVVGLAEGMYWKYESFMKQQDADFNTVVGAAGELFSIRTGLFNGFDDSQILDDFVISMQVCMAGYKIEYEPLAYAVETPSASLRDEEKRKIRIAAGAFQSINYLKQCLNFFRYPLLTTQYFSRRVLRWVACPLLLFLVLASNTWLVVYQQGPLFNYLLLAQGVFYLLALCGRIFIALGWRMGILNIPFYFVFMNYCLVRGFFKHMQGSQTVLWEKSMREAIE